LTHKLSPRELRDAFGSFATGVTVVTAVRPNGEPVGVTANSFTSLSIDPPLLLWCLNAASESLAAFALGAAFAVHVLAHSQRELALHFARRRKEKFEISADWRAAPQPPALAEVLCRFECRVHALYPGGDHTIVVGEVLKVTRHQGAPLAFHSGRFGNVTVDPGSPHLDPWMGWKDGWF
jgi:3-hydroxy-9,10-secoandrosta-1,3,5(10)-triene-9,17-dione monooxygenase reductase component